MMKINWGILGCAGIAEKAFIPAIQESGNGILYGIASRDSKRAWDWALNFGFRKSYHSYEALLEDREIDAVYVPLPNSLHAEWYRRSGGGELTLCFLLPCFGFSVLFIPFSQSLFEFFYPLTHPARQFRYLLRPEDEHQNERHDQDLR